MSHLVRLDVGHEVGGAGVSHGHLPLDLVEEVLLTAQEIRVRELYLFLFTLNKHLSSKLSYLFLFTLHKHLC